MQHALYLLRHGQTEWSATGRHTGRTDIPLTTTGQDQARAAGAMLTALRGTRTAAVVLSSPRQRALHTAALAGLDVDEQVAQLAEWDYGHYEGRTTEEIRATVRDWTVWTHAVPGGESLAQVAARADGALDRIRTTLADTDVIVVGHGHFSRVLVSRWLGFAASCGVHFAVGPASVTVLGHERGAPQIRHLNVSTGQAS